MTETNDQQPEALRRLACELARHADERRLAIETIAANVNAPIDQRAA